MSVCQALIFIFFNSFGGRPGNRLGLLRNRRTAPGVGQIVPDIGLHIRIGQQLEPAPFPGAEQIHMVIGLVTANHVPDPAFAVAGSGDGLGLQPHLTAHGGIDLSEGLAVAHPVAKQGIAGGQGGAQGVVHPLHEKAGELAEFFLVGGVGIHIQPGGGEDRLHLFPHIPQGIPAGLIVQIQREDPHTAPLGADGGGDLRGFHDDLRVQLRPILDDLDEIRLLKAGDLQDQTGLEIPQGLGDGLGGPGDPPYIVDGIDLRLAAAVVQLHGQRLLTAHAMLILDVLQRIGPDGVDLPDIAHGPFHIRQRLLGGVVHQHDPGLFGPQIHQIGQGIAQLKIAADHQRLVIGLQIADLVGGDGGIAHRMPAASAQEQDGTGAQDQKPFHGPASFLQGIVGIFGKAVPQNLMGLLHDDEGAGVDLHHRLLELGQLILFHGGQHHLGVLLGVVALPIEVGHAPVQLVTDGGRNGFVFLGDDEGHLGVVEMIDDGVDDLAGGEHGDEGIEHIVEIAEHDTGGGGHHEVDAQADLADVHIGPLELEQADEDVGAAGGGIDKKHQPQTEAADHTAVDGRQQRLGINGGDPGKEVDEQGEKDRTQYGADQELQTDFFTAQQKQGQIDEGSHHAHGSEAQQLGDNHGDTGDAAGVEALRLQKQVEAQSKQGAAQSDLAGPDQKFQYILHNMTSLVVGLKGQGNLLLGCFLLLEDGTGGRQALGPITALVLDVRLGKQDGGFQSGLALGGQHRNTLSGAGGLGQQGGRGEQQGPAVGGIDDHLLIRRKAENRPEGGFGAEGAGELFPIGLGFVGAEGDLCHLSVFVEEQQEAGIIAGQHHAEDGFLRIQPQLLGQIIPQQGGLGVLEVPQLGLVALALVRKDQQLVPGGGLHGEAQLVALLELLLAGHPQALGGDFLEIALSGDKDMDGGIGNFVDLLPGVQLLGGGLGQKGLAGLAEFLADLLQFGDDDLLESAAVLEGVL